MKSLLIFIKSNFKKTKAQSLAITLLLFITSLLFSLCLFFNNNYSNNFDKLHNNENGADANFVMAGLNSELSNLEENYLKNNQEIKDYEYSDITIMDGQIHYGEDFYRTVAIGISVDTSLNKRINKFIIDDISQSSGVYLPYQFYVSGNYNVGDDFVFYQKNEILFECKVVGFYQETTLSGQQDKIISYIFTNDIYKETVEPTFDKPFIKYSLLSVQLKDSSKAKLFEFNLLEEASSNYDLMQIIESNTKDLSKDSRYASQMIIKAVLLVASIIFALVSIILIMSNISFFIQSNMKSYGMLKALGYSSNKLRLTLILQFIFVGLIGIILGISTSYIIFPRLNKSIEATSGIKYVFSFSFINLIIVLFSLVSLIIICSLISSHKIRKLTPLNAIKNNTEKIKERNFFPIEKSRLNIDLNIALKNALLNIKHYIVIFLSIFGISLGIVFSTLMYQNAVSNPSNIKEIIVQNAEIQITIDKEQNDNLINYFEQEERIKNYILYDKENKVLINDRNPLKAIIIDNQENLINNSLLFKGSYPNNDKEVCLGGLYASRNNINIGDNIKCFKNNKEFEYTVSGLIQTARDNGETILFIKEGYEKFTTLNELTYLISLNYNGTKTIVIDKLEKLFPQAKIEDYEAITNTSTSSFLGLMKIIIIGIIILCISLMVFVLYNTVRTILFKKKKEISIMKAIGYRNKRIMLEVALSFVPVVLISLIICIPIACVLINPIFTMFVYKIGIVHSMFKFSYGFTAVCGLFMFMLSFFFVYLLTIRIKKNTPKDLLG